MILEDATKDAFGYYASTLTHGSNKLILVACDKSRKVRVITKKQYCSLCKSCAQKGKINHFLGKHHTDETKGLMCKNHIDFKGKNNPNFGKALSEKQKAKISIANKGNTYSLGCKRSDATKDLISAANKGEKNGNWQGGKSFEPYCIKFDEAYKQLIRTKFSNKCFWCGMTTEENGRALDVHHVKYNKQCGCDGTKCICVPLCRSCHSRSGSDRVGWQEKITAKLEMCGVEE